MKTLKSAIGTLLALGVFAVPAISNAQVTYNPRHPVTELHSTGGGSGSFAAAAVMGAMGFSAAPVPPNFEQFITSGCTGKTKSLAAPPIGTGSGPLSVWPSTCNPDGMALFLNQFSPPNPPGEPAVHWITYKTTDQNSALGQIIAGLQLYGSPGIVPIYGQADHWVAITQVTANGSTILNVRAFDGGPIGGMDSGFNSTYVGLQSWGGTAWRNTFFTVVTAINPSCDGNPGGGCGAPPTSDPFANKYLLMYEPPQSGGTRLASNFAPITTFAASPGIVAKGSMNETVAQVRVKDALIAGGIHKDPQMWAGIEGASPGQAFRVAGVWPSGAQWDYYLVPMISSKNSNEVVGFAQLDAADGSFQGVNVFQKPVAFSPVSATRAREIAASQLGLGESLSGGQLSWNPRSNTKLSKSPNAPYYEFAVAGSKGATIRVRLNDGAVVRN